MAWHTLERSALVEALLTAGPGAPTLCEGWRTEHLAAHVVLRQGSPTVALGLVVPGLHGRTERVTLALGDSSVTGAGYQALVERVRTPPRWSPVAWAGDLADLTELFVHTEDVRRAGPAGASVEARTRTAAHDDALWRALTRMARLAYRRSPVGVVLVDTAGREVRARVAPRASRALPTSPGPSDVVVRGALDDLLLHAFGRSSAARVLVDGAPDAVAAMEGFRPG